MKHITITDSTTRYTRISKAEARKLFACGKPFYIIAHKMRPGFPFSMGMTIFQPTYKEEGRTFEWAVDNFEWHNANCHETGTYAAFYTAVQA